MGISIARITLILAAALSAAVLSACGGDGDDESSPTPEVTAPPAATREPTIPPYTPNPEEAGVIAVFNEQLEHLRAGDFDALYATYSPAFQSQCTQEALVASIQATAIEPDRLEFEDVKATVQGDTAALTYNTLYDEQTVAIINAEEPNTFVRIDGRWYDELDGPTSC